MTHSRNLFAVIAVLAMANAALANINYCNDKVTSCNGYKHIACDNNGAFQSTCRPNASIVPMTPALRNLILSKHNALRNEFAGGVDGFQSANRLGVVHWDDGLAKLAELNVKKCDVSQDACRNTKDFKYVGQNIAKSDWQNENYSVEEVTQLHIDSWYLQKRFASKNQLLSYPMVAPESTFAHFTVMTHQKSAYVGCAIMRQSAANGFTRHLTTCNYSHDNVVAHPIYVPGPAASQCKTGKDSVYKNLCSANENYAINSLVL